MNKLHFSIGAELLRELGERLVGKPYIALAELVKNSYDADATEVLIKFSPDQDRIEIIDNGHGMTFDEFKKHWMRIGTTHKKAQKSRDLKRLMTGSKGVGRLAVQFLAHQFSIKTFPKQNSCKCTQAEIDWREAVKARDLMKVEVDCEEQDRGPQDASRTGTHIVLRELKQKWEANSVGKLAADLWWLQPPFGTVLLGDSKNDFRIYFESTQAYEKIFQEHINAIKNIWIARLVGKVTNGKATLSLEFQGEGPITANVHIGQIPNKNEGQSPEGAFDPNYNLNKCHFEIRIYNLSGKQKFGIKVGEAREYFANHGGVHVYDGGFRLPYYGLPESDWLKLEYDHSHRKHVSQLLPREIQVRRALTDLPTLGRVLGVVHVNTADEPNLKIMITRDRLAETIAYNDLVKVVRYAMDWYANETAQRKIEKKSKEAPTEPTSLKFEHVEQILEHYETEIPKKVYKEVYKQVQTATTAVEKHQELIIQQMGLLAPLATAGISALSYQHELKKQFAYIEDAIRKMKDVDMLDFERQQKLINSLTTDLKSWLERAKATNLLFDYIADAENIRSHHRLCARAVIEDIATQTHFLARGTHVDYSQLDDHLYLPEASFAQWGAIFQNVFINAFNAMLDSPQRQLHISSRSDGKSQEILIQDTGYGINLKDADRLFKPFERASRISAERKALGYGGTGLGLTIVRLLASNIGCRVRFVPPEDEFSTAFSIQWRET